LNGKPNDNSPELATHHSANGARTTAGSSTCAAASARPRNARPARHSTSAAPPRRSPARCGSVPCCGSYPRKSSPRRSARCP